MKKQQHNKIGLKKLTIASINPKAMIMINGGECIVTDGDTGTHPSFCYGCGPTTHIF